MENNDTVVEETTETSTEDVNIETNEGVEDTVESLRGQVAKFKAIAERKDKKLQANSQGEEAINKTNTEQSSLSREEAIFFAKGNDEKDLKLAQKIANLEGGSILTALEDPYYQSKVAERKQADAVKANSMGASNGSGGVVARTKDINDMSEAEHRAHVAKEYGIK